MNYYGIKAFVNLFFFSFSAAGLYHTLSHFFSVVWTVLFGAKESGCVSACTSSGSLYCDFVAKLAGHYAVFLHSPIFFCNVYFFHSYA